MAKATSGLAILCMALGLGCSDTDDDDIVVSKLDGGGVGSLDAAAPVSDAQVPSLDSGSSSPLLSFFVSSQTSSTGNLGGLSGADARCQALATAVGAGSKTWHAFLSVERDLSTNMPLEARSRIGTGPWYNAKGNMVAANVMALLALSGNADVFIDEHGNKINGQWTGSPTPVEHDILTGTEADGGVAIGKTCADWTSASDAGVAIVGHADGLGPMQNAAPPFNSWYSAHENAGCNDTAPRGGAGRLYCFATN